MDPAPGFARRVVPLWLVLLAGPLAWLVALQGSYVLVEPACTGADVLPLVGVALGLGLAAWGLVAARRTLSRAAEVPQDAAEREARTRFLAVGGLVLGGFFALVVVTHALPILLLHPCEL